MSDIMLADENRDVTPNTFPALAELAPWDRW